MARFRIGQMVVFGERLNLGTISGRPYKVLSTIELPDGGFCYRVKSIAELSDRLVQERELEPRPSPFSVIARVPTSLFQDLGPRPKPRGPIR